MRRIGIAVFLLLSASPVAAEEAAERLQVDWPSVRLYSGAKVEGTKLSLTTAGGQPFSGTATLSGLGHTQAVEFRRGLYEIAETTITGDRVTVAVSGAEISADIPMINGFWALAPALIAILLALVTKQVLIALGGGVWVGAVLLEQDFLRSFPGALDILVGAAVDEDRIKIIAFTMTVAGLVGIIGKTGGTGGIVSVVSRWAKGPRTASLSTAGVGLFIFFDDYASSLLVGTTMRPVTDRFKISREKLAYLVDSTAAPIASLALISTWIGYEVSVLKEAMAVAGIERDAYEVFVHGMPSRFYQIFALAFVFIIAGLGRDFGSMLKAERRARREGKLIRDGGAPLMDTGLLNEAEQLRSAPSRPLLALLPIGILIGTVLTVLYVTGLAGAQADPEAFRAAQEAGWIRTLDAILGNAASYDALLYGAAAGALSALLMARALQVITLSEGIDAFLAGVRAMTLACIVLLLAWSIGEVMDDLRAGPFVAGALKDSLPAWSLPSLTFILAALIAGATGTSWGTMAILFPIVIPVVAAHAGAPTFEALLYGSSSAILGGAVFGDHCSPISDTTVLSSIACASDHVDHTRTQAPYAAVCGMAALVLGYLPIGFGLSPWPWLVVGLVSLTIFVRLVGKRPEAPET